MSQRKGLKVRQPSKAAKAPQRCSRSRIGRSAIDVAEQIRPEGQAFRVKCVNSSADNGRHALRNRSGYWSPPKDHVGRATRHYHPGRGNPMAKNLRSRSLVKGDPNCGRWSSPQCVGRHMTHYSPFNTPLRGGEISRRSRN